MPNVLKQAFPGSPHGLREGGTNNFHARASTRAGIRNRFAQHEASEHFIDDAEHVPPVGVLELLRRFLQTDRLPHPSM